MKQFPLPFSLLLLLLLLSSCSSTKWLANHRAEIQRLTGDNVSGQEKFDGLATVTTRVLDEALRFGSVKKNVQHVQKFSRQNEKDIEKLIADIDAWQQGLTTGQKIKFGAHVLVQPYSRQMVQLVPRYKRKVDRKINQLILLNKVLGVFKVGNLIK